MKSLKKLTLHIVLILYLILSLLSLSKTDFWWRFATAGEIYSNPQLYKGKIYFGNNDRKFYSVNEKSGKEVWSFKTEKEISTSPVFTRDKVFFTSGNSLYALDAKNGKEFWSYKSEKSYNFVTDIKIHKHLLYVGDAGGSLHAINTNGEHEWTFYSKPVKKLEDIMIGYGLNWFGAGFEIKDNVIYWGSSDGNLYAISAYNGRLEWKFDSGAIISSNIVITKGRIYFGNRTGKTYVLQQKNGSLVKFWRDVKSNVKCIAVRANRLPWQKKLLLVSYEDGKIIKKESEGKIIWSYKTKNLDYLCPIEEYSNVFITQKNGLLTVLDSESGRKKWDYKTEGDISISPVLTRVRFTPNIYLFESTGTISAIKINSGKKIWNYRTNASINTHPATTGNYFYIASTDGGLYRINKFTGKADLTSNDKNKFKVSQQSIKIGTSQIVELKVNFDDSILTNKWKDVSLKTIFSHSSGKILEIDGFYYDKDTWKVRFNPPLKGKWSWRLVFELAGNTLEKSGSFDSHTDTKQTYLKISKKNPKRLTLDGKTIFNNLGFQDAIIDYNGNGYPLDDWAIGNSDPIVATGSSVNIYVPSNRITNLSTYLKTYSPDQAGFNLYRYNVANASFNLWEPQGINNGYLLNEGKWADEFLTELKNKDYQVWMTIFGFGIPYSDSVHEIEKKEISDYVKYIIARYGAYVSIWEIANEATLFDSIVDLIAETIRSVDFEYRPISVSWEKPLHNSIDIISPHWYESEPLSESDLRTVQRINKYEFIDKPVIFGEQGNHILNWDEDSAIRMRIRAWTAFFNEGSLIFWNNSDKKQTVPINPESAIYYSNQYIGGEERKYMKILQNFSQGIDISAKKDILVLDNPSVRGYFLNSNKEQLGYLYHFENQQEEIMTTVNLYLPKTGVIEWLDPLSGKVISKTEIASGYNYLLTPLFNLDLAFIIKYH